MVYASMPKRKPPQALINQSDLGWGPLEVLMARKGSAQFAIVLASHATFQVEGRACGIALASNVKASNVSELRHLERR